MLGVGIRYTVGTEMVLSPSNFCIGQKRDKIDTMGRVRNISLVVVLKKLRGVRRKLLSLQLCYQKCSFNSYFSISFSTLLSNFIWVLHFSLKLFASVQYFIFPSHNFLFHILCKNTIRRERCRTNSKKYHQNGETLQYPNFRIVSNSSSCKDDPWNDLQKEQLHKV